MVKVARDEEFSLGEHYFPFNVCVWVDGVLAREDKATGHDVEAELLRSIDLFLAGPLVLHAGSFVPHNAPLSTFF